MVYAMEFEDLNASIESFKQWQCVYAIYYSILKLTIMIFVSDYRT